MILISNNIKKTYEKHDSLQVRIGLGLIGILYHYIATDNPLSSQHLFPVVSTFCRTFYCVRSFGLSLYSRVTILKASQTIKNRNYLTMF